MRNVSRAQKNIRHLEKKKIKETLQLPDKACSLSCRNTSYLLWCSGFILFKLWSVHVYKFMDIFMYRSISFNQFTSCTLWPLGKKKSVNYFACKMLNIVCRLCGDYLNWKCIESPNKRTQIFWGRNCLCVCMCVCAYAHTHAPSHKIWLLNSKKRKMWTF